ncbi:MAG TPA: hypothetical protein VJ020_02540 [Anaerolineales bacterium]|nr:hypothetical protein [Anaerolineales bacterium]
MTSVSNGPRESDARAMLAVQMPLPGDYLIVGPHASFAYHRWLRPIPKMIHLRIRAGDLAQWQTALAPPWVTRVSPPASADTQSAMRLAILETGLTDALHARRRMMSGLAYISPEDWCVALTREAKTQIAISEVAALLVAQRQKLDWAYLNRQIAAAELGERFTRIIETINREAGRPLLPLPPFVAAYALDTPLPEFPQPYTRFDQPWHVKRATIAKVLQDLRAKWQEPDERPVVG